jgi:hypothetical protein
MMMRPVGFLGLISAAICAVVFALRVGAKQPVKHELPPAPDGKSTVVGLCDGQTSVVVPGSTKRTKRWPMAARAIPREKCASGRRN